MRVGIIGNYGHDNNGDEAILSGILKQLEQLSIPKENIVVFSNNPDNTIERYNIQAVRLLHKKGNILASIVATLKAHTPVIQSLDLLIIGGGGLLMDMYKRDAPLYSSLGMLAHYFRKKIIIYGVGAGPITTKPGSFLIRTLANKANIVTVRDNDSKELLKRIGVKNDIDVIGDPAFSLSGFDKPSRSGVQKIGVTAVPYYDKRYWPIGDENRYIQYVAGFAQALDQLVNEKNVDVTFFSTKYPQDVQVTKDIVERMTRKDAITLLEDNLHPEELIRICGEQDVIVGTRLHSLILSVVAQTPIIGVGYHKKVADFMKHAGLENQYMTIDHLVEKPQSIVEKVNFLENDWSQTEQDAKQVALEMKQQADKGLMYLRKIGE